MKQIVLAGGCFWGVEAYFQRIQGVTHTEVAYANGHTQDPSYREVCSGNTGHAEVCLVEYDPSVITLSQLLERFFRIIDPTLIDRQGPDIGSQYRTGIYYTDESDLSVINEAVDLIRPKYKLPIMTEMCPLGLYFRAEDYHQQYLVKNPHGYCHINLNA